MKEYLTFLRVLKTFLQTNRAKCLTGKTSKKNVIFGVIHNGLEFISCQVILRVITIYVTIGLTGIFVYFRRQYINKLSGQFKASANTTNSCTQIYGSVGRMWQCAEFINNHRDAVR